MIEIKNIHKSYGSLEVLKGIDAVIEQGEIVSIVGASGAGKTTLLQIVGTLDKPDCGEILYDGRRVDNLPDREMARFRNGNIGFVFQFHQLLPEFTAFENVCIPGLIGRRPKAEVERRAGELLRPGEYVRHLQHPAYRRHGAPVPADRPGSAPPLAGDAPW